MACWKPVVSNAVIGLAPLRPARMPPRNSPTPAPMGDRTPSPVMTTRRPEGISARTACSNRRGRLLRGGGVIDDRDDALQVHHPRQLVLIDLDVERPLQGR